MAKFTDERKEIGVVITFKGDIDFETIKENLDQCLGHCPCEYNVKPLEDVLRDIECSGG